MSGLVVALVPAYDEERYVASVLVRLREYVDRVIVCDDGSVDLTGDIAEAMGAVAVRHSLNMVEVPLRKDIPVENVYQNRAFYWGVLVWSYLSVSLMKVRSVLTAASARQVCSFPAPGHLILYGSVSGRS